MEINKQNYQAWFEVFFQQLSQQINRAKELINFISKNFIQAKHYTDIRCYHQAICICSALTRWLTQLLSSKKVVYQKSLQRLLAQCDTVYEYVYFHWLRLDYQNFMRYHYQDNNMRHNINKKIDKIIKFYSEKNYQKAVDLYTNFIVNINGFSAKACNTVKNLTVSWHVFAAMQRQQILFDWRINNNDCLDFDKYVEMLRSDLALLREVKYFTEQAQLEAQCRLDFINLLFRKSIKQVEICELRRKFCVAFDNFSHRFNIFNQGQENENIALILLGLAILDAYEGNKQEMLIGLKLAVQYDHKLKNFTQIIIKRLPFYMDWITTTDAVLVNPLVQFDSTKKMQPPILIRK